MKKHLAAGVLALCAIVCTGCEKDQIEDTVSDLSGLVSDVAENENFQNLIKDAGEAASDALDAAGNALDEMLATTEASETLESITE